MYTYTRRQYNMGDVVKGNEGFVLIIVLFILLIIIGSAW
ncbi:YjcZ family sporulation protein [Bacillus suaedaesalsae]|uniref:YjcZ family sporulation protein n=1 Tax=Bacillus suaedaesalsae TaxID=2810349 RepID=A0ABS2DNG7_9BACI|nr:YjcZ family sporulation protein [Bacillus suaedaesalsae]MBM6619932.1 YjcZ family sporulation protein [Bacillus suaedaesalsae]